MGGVEVGRGGTRDKKWSRVEVGRDGSRNSQIGKWCRWVRVDLETVK